MAAGLAPFRMGHKLPPGGKGRQGRSALRQRGRRAVTVAGPASLAHGPSCGRGLGGGGGGSLDTSTSGDGSCLGCQEDVLTLLYVRSEPSMPKVQVGGAA